MEISSNSLKLLGMLNSDEEKLAKFKTLDNLDSIYAYSKTLIPDYTKEEFKEFIKIMSELKDPATILKNTSQSSEIDDSQLDKVAGGLDIGFGIKVLNSFDEGYRSMDRTNQTILQVARLVRSTTDMMDRMFQSNDSENKKQN